LFAKVVASGGAYRTVRNLLRLLFLGDGAYYSGGVIVAFALCNEKGELERSGLIRERTAYRPIFDWVRQLRDAWRRQTRRIE
jgi:hypothetical protein